MSNVKEIQKKCQLLFNYIASDKYNDAGIQKHLDSMYCDLDKPDFDNIPKSLKNSIGVFCAQALTEVSIIEKSSYSRSCLSLLWKAVRAAHGPEKDIRNIVNAIKMINEEIARIEGSGEDAQMSNLFRITNATVDMCADLVFSGYGDIGNDTYHFASPQEDV